VAAIARRHGVNDNVIFNWRRLYRRGLLPGQSERLVPVEITETPKDEKRAAPPASLSAGHIEIELRGGRVRVYGAVPAEMVREVLRELAR
jgi:transposase-like protein